MIRLARVVEDRNNNFHLLRLVAATLVLFSHSFPMVTGDMQSEPLRVTLGCTPGSIAVDLFFLVSGLLVTMSLVRRNSVGDFIRARFFRIWPALIVAVALAVLVLGPIFTTFDLGAYFSSRVTWRYAVDNIVLFRGVAYVLPGVFVNNPTPGGINGSLWTLPLEVACYIALLLAWIAVRKPFSERVFTWTVTATWAGLLAWHLFSLASMSLENSPARLDLMFATGAAAYLHRDRILLSGWVLLAAAVALAISTLHPTAFGVIYTIVLPYAMLAMAYLPKGRILRFNALGDYSYGVYIYAFPIQQTIAYLFPSFDVAALFGVSLVATLLAAVASWHFIEKPALRLARPPAQAR